MKFGWNEWNEQHIARHGVGKAEAEEVIDNARPPYPTYRGEGKYLVWGPGPGGRLLQVVFLLDEEGTIYVIHSRPLTDREKQHFRRRRT